MRHKENLNAGKKAISLIALIILYITFIIDNCISQTWSPLGSGMNSYVYTVTVYNNDLIAGGSFTTAGGVACNRIARWNGMNWMPLGSGMNGSVTSLTVYNGSLIAAGSFTNAGGTTVNRIAKWNDTAWTPLGSGITSSMSSSIYSMVVHNNELYVGGYFDWAGGITVHNIAKWNGNSWFALSSGSNDNVEALTVYNNQVVAGGYFSNIGGLSINKVAKWNGSAWSSIGNGINSYSGVFDLFVYNNELIAGGPFTSVNGGGTSANYIAKYDGSTWGPIGSGMNDRVQFLTAFRGNLIAAGQFSTAGGISANRIAKWNGTSWSALGSGLNNWAYTLVVYNNELIVGGLFTTAGGIAVNYIAAWSEPVQYHDVSCGPFLSLPSAIQINSPANIKTKIQNLSVHNEPSVTVKFFINDSLNNTTNKSLNSGQADSVNNIWTPAATGSYTLKYVTTVPLDSNRFNDTLKTIVNVTLTGITVNKETPNCFSLSQNYPNPFNPVTNIKYGIPKNSFVTLKVYDVMGREVRSLVNETQSAGNYSVDFNGSDLTSGVYFYKLTVHQGGSSTVDFTETKKMILIK